MKYVMFARTTPDPITEQVITCKDSLAPDFEQHLTAARAWAETQGFYAFRVVPLAA